MLILFLATETWWSETSRRLLMSLDVQTQFSPKLQVWFFPSRSQSIPLELWQISRMKTTPLCSLHQNPDCTKVPKTDFHDNLNFKLDFLCSRQFGFYHQHVDRKLYSYEGEFDWKVFVWILASISWCPKMHWRFLVLNYFAFQNQVLP